MANRKLFNEMCRYADSGKDEYFKRGQFMSCEEMSMRMGCDLTGPTLMSMVNAGWIMVRKPQPGSSTRVNFYAIPETIETQVTQKMEEMKRTLGRNLVEERANALELAKVDYEKKLKEVEESYLSYINRINDKYDYLEELKRCAKEAFCNTTE